MDILSDFMLFSFSKKNPRWPPWRHNCWFFKVVQSSLHFVQISLLMCILIIYTCMLFSHSLIGNQIWRPFWFFPEILWRLLFQNHKWYRPGVFAIRFSLAWSPTLSKMVGSWRNLILGTCTYGCPGWFCAAFIFDKIQDARYNVIIADFSKWLNFLEMFYKY